jgi:hypothetical protein
MRGDGKTVPAGATGPSPAESMASFRDRRRPPSAAKLPAQPPPELTAATADDRGERPTLDEAPLLARLQSVQESDPSLAYDLAREGRRRFPASANAPEWAARVVKSLALLGRLSEARREAEIMVNAYPESPWTREVEAHTGAHPRRSESR